jgi:hypothetical protein
VNLFVRKYVGGLALVGNSFKIGGKTESLASYFYFKYLYVILISDASSSAVIELDFLATLANESFLMVLNRTLLLLRLWISEITR